MNAQSLTHFAEQNPAAVEEGQKQLQSILLRSATDPEFRSKLLSEPRAAIAESTGQQVPASMDIQFVENAGTATFVLPDPIDPSAELSDDELEAVAGGLAALLAIGAVAAGVAVGGAIASIIDHYN